MLLRVVKYYTVIGFSDVEKIEISGPQITEYENWKIENFHDMMAPESHILSNYVCFELKFLHPMKLPKIVSSEIICLRQVSSVFSIF